MTTQQYLINRKMNMLDLASTLGNISEACRKLGVTRQHFYDVKQAVEEFGVDGLIEKSETRPNPKNRIPLEFEEKILAYSLLEPTHGQTRVSNEILKQDGLKISAGGVRSIWLRHGLERSKMRLKRLEKWAAENQGVLTESQVVALEEAKLEKEAHGEIETFHPGFMLGQDTYYVGYIKGVGKIYHPQTNGITEKLNQTIQNEFYKVAFRKKLYSSLEDLQADLDTFMEKYNHERTHQGKRCQGKTPMETFESSLELAYQYSRDPNGGENEETENSDLQLN